MYRASEIARYVIDYSYDQKKTVSNLRLQKILYFIQAEFLVSKGMPCFNEEILAWNLGPVVPRIYHEYKMYGSASIPASGTDGQYYGIENQDIELINEIIDQCNRYSTSRLVQLTHNQDPWIVAFNSNTNNVITNESILRYFGEG